MRAYIGFAGGVLVAACLAVWWFIHRAQRGPLLRAVGRCFAALALAGSVRVAFAALGWSADLASAIGLTITAMAVSNLAWQLWRVNGSAS